MLQLESCIIRKLLIRRNFLSRLQGHCVIYQTVLGMYGGSLWNCMAFRLAAVNAGQLDFLNTHHAPPNRFQDL